MDKINELVFTALGEASMCWHPIPEGVFDSTKAEEIGDKLAKHIANMVIDAEIKGLKEGFFHIDTATEVEHRIASLKKEKEGYENRKKVEPIIKKYLPNINIVDFK